MRSTRRDILRLGGTAAATFTAASYSRIMGANDKINMGWIGAGDRGTYVIKVFNDSKQVNVGAIAEVYGTRLDKAQSTYPGSKGFNDHRKLLEMKEIDAVLIATPDHWHAGCAIDALSAGKDVYVE